MNLKIKLFSLLFAVGGAALIAAPSANAASPYDNSVIQIDKLELSVYPGNSGDTQDVSLDWFNQAIESLDLRCTQAGGYGNWCEARDQLYNDIITEGDQHYWAVVPTHDGYHYSIYVADKSSGVTGCFYDYDAPYNNRFYFGFCSTSSASITKYYGFTNLGTYNGAPKTSKNIVALVQPSTETIYINPSANIGLGRADQYPNSAKVWLFNFPITYPTNYEGDIVQETYNPGEQVDYTPDWYLAQGNDCKVTIQDKRFSTFDGISWTCSEDGNSLIEEEDPHSSTGLAPAVYFEIWNEDFTTKIDEGVLNSTAPIEWQAPKVNEKRTYNIRGWYDCGGSLDFTEVSEQEFVLTAQGMLGSNDIVENCILDEAPFIDITGCLSNLGNIVHALTFGTISIGNNWTASQSCRTLMTLDNWLGRPDQQVCPYFPQYVRSVVTPFVTFILGLITVKFIANRMSGDYR